MNTWKGPGTRLAVFLMAGFIGTTAADAQDKDVYRTILEELNRLPTDDSPETTAEGLAKDSRPEVLTRERAYALALVRHRDKRTALAPTLDPKTLAEAAKRFGVEDYARFRKDFLGEGPGAFPDPSAHFFGLLALRQAVDNALVDVAISENLVKLYRELNQGESSGLTQLEIDEASRSVQGARDNLIEQQTSYRDLLDEFKVELGLSPGAPIVLDRSELAPFRDRFEQLVRWSTDPGRDLAKLDEIVAQLPQFSEITIGEGEKTHTLFDPTQYEPLVNAAGQLAAKNRGRADAQFELRARKLTRKLVTQYTASRFESRNLILSFRQQSNAFEQIVAPPQPGAGRPNLQAAKLVAVQAQIRESEDRLVEIWATSQSLRLALYRDLGILPAADWKAFLGEIRPPIGDNPAPPARPAADLPPPAPPAPPTPLPPPHAGCNPESLIPAGSPIWPGHGMLVGLARGSTPPYIIGNSFL